MGLTVLGIFERVLFCSPGWPGISDPPDCWDYRYVSSPPSKDLFTQVPWLLFIVIWGKQLEVRSEGEPCHTTVPCSKVSLSSHSEECFQLQVRVKPAAQP